MERFFTYDTDIGPVTFAEAEGNLTMLAFGRVEVPNGRQLETPLLQEACCQLESYLAGARRDFALPLCPKGTPFQQRVWQSLLQIPYGKTVSYKDLAESIGSPKACRAVGMANHRNPIAIVIPCHRVVGANGSLTGYAGGLPLKQRLLELEQRYSGGI